MGVPSLFREIVQNKSYKNILTPVVSGEMKCDYLLLDFNGAIYSAYGKVLKDIIGKNMTKDEKETMIINEVLRQTQQLVCEVIKPKKLTYIAFDGPAPYAKIAEARGRRYKAYFEKMLFKEMKKKLGEVDDKETWDPSANIAPGTVFMEKMANAFDELIKSKGLQLHEPKMEIILSSSSVPAEGEHKILPVVRNLAKNSKTKDDIVYIYSPDADLISLSVLTHKSNIHILRKVSAESDENFKELYSSYDYFLLNIDNLREGWVQELSKDSTVEGGADPFKILTDYSFLLFFVGTDFVKSLSFLKIKYKQAGFGMLKSIYNEVKKTHKSYLIDYNWEDPKSEPIINNAFLKDILVELAKKEDKFMKQEYQETLRQMKGYTDARRAEKEAGLTPYELFETRYTHIKVCHPDHPLFKDYHKEFKKIDYTQDKRVWREQFYEYYLGVNRSDIEEYNKKRTEMVIAYFESLVFNLRYYIKGIPSWTWHYKYRNSPLPSDMAYVIQNVCKDLNEIKFEEGKPFTPLEQLSMVLPPQNKDLLPEVLRPVMTDLELGCVQYYPDSFRLDVAAGFKTMYSHPILPEIDVNHLIPVVKTLEEKLTGADKKRNEIKPRPTKYV
jgi:5'-3' exoribonuclease 1